MLTTRLAAATIIYTFTANSLYILLLQMLNCTRVISSHINDAHNYIDHMQLHTYLIRNRTLHVVNNHMHLAVAILSGKKNEVVKQCYMLLAAQHDFRISVNKQLLETGV